MQARTPLLCLLLLGLGACLPEASAQGRRRRAATPAQGTPASPSGRSPQHVFHRAQGTWAGGCIATDGCAAPAPIARCPSGTSARPFAEVIDQRLTLAGQRVTVRGQLDASASCTEMACIPRDGVQQCCNHCGASGVFLRGAAQSALDSLALGDGTTPAFACTGDDSGLCCATVVPTGEVVVTGTLRAIPNSGGRYTLEAPTLCAP